MAFLLLLYDDYESLTLFQKIDKSDILKCIIHGKPVLSKYPPDVRKFCFALNYHSPAAYRIVRDHFEKRLPHPKTLTAWLSESDINGEHGIRDETTKRLAGFVKELQDETGEQLICSVILDEMYIRKQLYWDQSKYEFAGFPTYEYVAHSTVGIAPKRRNKGGTGGTLINDGTTGRVTRASERTTKQHINTEKDILDADEFDMTEPTETDKKKEKVKSPLATRALVFMLSAINKMFEFPVGYHFVNGLGSEGLTELVKEVIVKVSACGVKISNLTFDGAKENVKMCENLGANLDPLSDRFKPFFLSPYDESCIYVIMDASHMEKLLRNLLGNHKVLFDENDEQIEWSYFSDLQELSKHGKLLTHKLTRKHTEEWLRNKMNVRLASETFSTTVADSFQIMREKEHPKFVNSYPTEKFTRMADRMFDILNSRDTRHSNMYKQPLNPENKTAIFEFIERSKISLKGLKMNVVRKRKGVEKTEKVNVLKTINRTPIVGFLANLTNVPLMYAQYVERSENDQHLKKMTHFRTYALSQDRLELMFAKVRARNGHNDNPNCVQFKGAYRRILANIEINPPASSNCMMFDPIDLHMFAPQSNVYSVSSRRPKIDIISDDVFQSNLKRFEEEEEEKMLESLSDLSGMNETTHLLEGFADTSIAYASKLIEESIAAGDFKCDCCVSVFAENEKLNNRSICLIPTKTPCESTYYICRIADKHINLYKHNNLNDLNSLNKQGKQNNFDFRVLYYKIFNNIDYDKIYAKSDFKDHEQHRFYLVKMIVRNYLQIKTAQISRNITYEQYNKIIRAKLTKWIHFQGQ